MYKLIYTDSVCLSRYKTFQTRVTTEQEDVVFRAYFLFLWKDSLFIISACFLEAASSVCTSQFEAWLKGVSCFLSDGHTDNRFNPTSPWKQAEPLTHLITEDENVCSCVLSTDRTQFFSQSHCCCWTSQSTWPPHRPRSPCCGPAAPGQSRYHGEVAASPQRRQRTARGSEVSGRLRRDTEQAQTGRGRYMSGLNVYHVTTRHDLQKTCPTGYLSPV